LTYEELNKQLIIESPKYDIWSLLSNIGVRVSTCPLAWRTFGGQRTVMAEGRALTDGH